MAAASTARPWMRATLPTGTIDAEERASAGNTYGSNAFGVPAGVVWSARGDPFIERLHTAANWKSGALFYLELMMRATSGTAHAQIYNETDGVEIAGSDVTTASGTFVRARGPAVALTDGKEHRVRVGSEAGDGGEAFGAGLIQF